MWGNYTCPVFVDEGSWAEEEGGAKTGAGDGEDQTGRWWDLPP